ncbi:hypothetical protein CXK86_01520 [Paenibacillus sp. BGI2013]|uniref:hypothetical protein n=1 Tax=unclassified Paenibacillus TaxID=185978 RepID=UPI000C6DA501|nr:hypothetical protein [Paenibacillus sp. BGI2013]PKQ92826.1 hypothetical protein CXK86_01520 [Paenibacillus sp. BGI2013]
MKLKKVIISIMLGALTLNILPIPQSHASTINIQGTTLYNDNGVEITKTDNGVFLNDEINNETLSLVYKNSEHTEATITDQNGNIQELFKDDNGNVYLDGELFLEFTTNSEQLKLDASTLNARLSAAENWTLFTTARYKQSLIDNVNKAAIAIASLYPYIGLVTGIAAVIQSVYNINKPLQSEIYLEIKQYHNNMEKTPSFYQIKTETSFYKNSNYTGLIGTTSSIKKPFQ